jgi:glycosyltransferase involved in cell wall biosynthesis
VRRRSAIRTTVVLAAAGRHSNTPRPAINPAIFSAMRSERQAPFPVGFLHLGSPEHGVSRYGRKLAAEMATRRDVEVVEVEVAEPPESPRFAAAALEAIRSLTGRAVIAIQYNRALFSEGYGQERLVRRLLAASPAPVVANLHDVYLDNPWTNWRKGESTLRVRWQRWRHHWTRTVPAKRALARLVEGAAATIVCFESERERLTGLRGADRVRVVPHFVEPRPNLPERGAARAALGIGDRRVITVLGYIHRRKGHDLVVDALPLLPADRIVAFVGTATAEHRGYLAALERRARKLVGEGRLIVTGFVDEPTLERWLVATDVAVCPFRFFSASGSLATWISAARPVVCHALPQIDEYRRVDPGAFSTFDRYRPDALAEAIERVLASPRAGDDPAMAKLRGEFSLAAVTARTLEVYREAALRADPQALHGSKGLRA